MTNVLHIAYRELKSYFVSPIAYVVVGGYLALTGFFFGILLAYSQQAGPGMAPVDVDSLFQYLFSNMMITLFFVIPLITMRLLAEETKSGTIELLLTSPVTDLQVVLGKFLGGLFLLLFMLVLSLQYPLICSRFSDLDLGTIAMSYLGIILLGAALLALGLFTSSLTRNQIIAAVLAFAAILIIWFVDGVSTYLEAVGQADAATKIFQYLSLNVHYEDFLKGIFVLKHTVYYVSFALFFLFATVLSLQTRRWR